MPADSELCRCGHVYAMHTHYRYGSDCGQCGPDLCRFFRQNSADRPTLFWLRRRLSRVREG